MGSKQTAQKMTVAEMVSLLCGQLGSLKPNQRYLLGIVGYPGAGKSTVSAWLEEGVNQRLPGLAKVVPLDGYHFANKKLEQMKLRELKGIPETFDAHGFIDLLTRLRAVTDRNVFCPLFDRSIEASIENAIVIVPENKLCIVEGNYLLLEREPWRQCKNYFDEVWFLDATFDIILPRLIDRHVKGGRTEEGAKEKVNSTDLPNARIIDETRSRADRIIAVVADL